MLDFFFRTPLSRSLIVLSRMGPVMKDVWAGIVVAAGSQQCQMWPVVEYVRTSVIIRCNGR